MLEKRPAGRVHRSERGLETLTLRQSAAADVSAVITVSPLPGGGVDDAEELVIGHGLGVEVRPRWPALHVLVGAMQ